MSDTVTVKALVTHTCLGKSYKPGDTYDVDPDLVKSLVVQGKAAPADAPEAAKEPAKYRRGDR